MTELETAQKRIEQLEAEIAAMRATGAPVGYYYKFRNAFGCEVWSTNVPPNGQSALEVQPLYTHPPAAQDAERKPIEEPRCAELREESRAMTPDKTPSEAETWLRSRYGAYRGHFAWRELEEAFNAGRGSPVVAGEPLQCTCSAKDMPMGTCCKVRSAFEKWYDEQNDGRLQPFDVFKGGWSTLHRMISTPQPTQAQAGAVPLTAKQMESGREAIFSTGNPYCPCDSKTFRKVAEWVERHHGIKGGQHGTDT